MEGAGAHLHVVGLEDDAALFGPVALQREDQALEGAPGSMGAGSLMHGKRIEPAA